MLEGVKHAELGLERFWQERPHSGKRVSFTVLCFCSAEPQGFLTLSNVKSGDGERIMKLKG